MVEVKGSTSVKDYHLQDCAVQYWVAQGAGYPIKLMELAHVDNTFVYQGDGRYQGLLKHFDITREVLALQEDVPNWVEDFKNMLAGPMPPIDVGDHCESPYECPFCYHCWPEGPDYPISILPRARKPFLDEILEEGYEDVRDIPDGRLGNENHERVRRVTFSGKPEIDPGLKKIFQDLEYLRYYLDFESLGAAVPLWKGTRPYQTFYHFNGRAILKKQRAR